MGSAFLYRFSIINDIPDIVERIEHTENLYAISMGRLNEAEYDIARIMLVPYEILSS